MRLTTLCLLASLAVGCGSSSSPEASITSPESVSARTDDVISAAGPLTQSLTAGWNPIAFQCATVTALNATSAAGMAYYVGGQAQTTSFTLAEVNAGEGPRRGLWVFATGAGNVTYSGTDAAVTLNLATGWNLVSLCTTASLGAGDLTVRQNGAVVALSSVVLPQFQELQADRTLKSVDLANGGRLTPGRATWVYSLAPVTLAVTGSGTAPASPTPTPTPAASPTAADISRLTSKFGSAVQITVGATEVTFTSQSVPDHVSAYWPTTNPLYQAYTNPAYRPNMGTIVATPLTIRIPRFPKEATTKTTTPLGPIGMSRNGVPFYNQYAANFSPLDMELAGMDQGNGHPNPMNQYHYHLEPLLMTAANGKTAFVGLLNDGFPVYGPSENGKTVTNADLDSYHGHFGATPDFPEGIYHYHITSTDPYINGGGFFGTPGVVSR